MERTSEFPWNIRKIVSFRKSIGDKGTVNIRQLVIALYSVMEYANDRGRLSQLEQDLLIGYKRMQKAMEKAGVEMFHMVAIPTSSHDRVLYYADDLLDKEELMDLVQVLSYENVADRVRLIARNAAKGKTFAGNLLLDVVLRTVPFSESAVSRMIARVEQSSKAAPQYLVNRLVASLEEWLGVTATSDLPVSVILLEEAKSGRSSVDSLTELWIEGLDSPSFMMKAPESFSTPRIETVTTLESPLADWQMIDIQGVPFYVERVVPNGNCFFQAVANALAVSGIRTDSNSLNELLALPEMIKLKSKQASAFSNDTLILQMRKDVGQVMRRIDWLKEQFGDCLLTVFGSESTDVERLQIRKIGQNVDTVRAQVQLQELMERKGFWANSVMIKLLAVAYKINWLIYNDAMMRWILIGCSMEESEWKRQPCVTLLYKGEHYDTLYMNQGGIKLIHSVDDLSAFGDVLYQ